MSAGFTMKSSIRISIIIGLVCLGFRVSADQFIYVRVSDFDPALSAFDEDVAGNIWTETEQEGALFGTVYGAPGDNNRDAAGPHLVIKLPEAVKAGESSDDGKTWIAWGRMFEPEALVTGNLAAIIVAFSHLLFNISGIVVWWPFKFVPISLAGKFSAIAIRKKIIPILYIIIVFFLIPILFISISR